MPKSTKESNKYSSNAEGLLRLEAWNSISSSSSSSSSGSDESSPSPASSVQSPTQVEFHSERTWSHKVTESTKEDRAEKNVIISMEGEGELQNGVVDFEAFVEALFDTFPNVV